VDIPIVSDMLAAMAYSLESLRAEITDVRLGRIDGEQGYVEFTFRGQIYEFPEPMDVLAGWSVAVDKRLCLRALLDHQAKVKGGSP
jgi:hypothetical protein